jgi:hypothetical protein
MCPETGSGSCQEVKIISFLEFLDILDYIMLCMIIIGLKAVD